MDLIDQAWHLILTAAPTAVRDRPHGQTTRTNMGKRNADTIDKTLCAPLVKGDTWQSRDPRTRGKRYVIFDLGIGQAMVELEAQDTKKRSVLKITTLYEKYARVSS